MDDDEEKVYRENLETEYPGFLDILDNLYNEFSEFLPDYTLTFNSSYAKICPKYKRSRSKDLSIIKPRKNGVTIGFRITDPAFDYLSIKEKGIDITIDDPRNNWYRIAIQSFDDYKHNKVVIDNLITKSEKEFQSRGISGTIVMDDTESKIKYCWYLNGQNKQLWEGNFVGIKSNILNEKNQSIQKIKPGDSVAIFTHGFETNNPPFGGNKLKYMDIHDYGVVQEDDKSGALTIKWSNAYNTKKRWFYYVKSDSLWKVEPSIEKDKLYAVMAQDLLDFTFKDKDQDLDKYREIYNKLNRTSEMTQTIEEIEKSLVEYPKNIILFGPPGTGKTYNTVNYAVSIIKNKPFADILAEDYDKVFGEYCKYKEENLIEFVTFHQSYSYEDFVEGIKPTVDKETKSISYDVEDGVFKKFCKLSSNNHKIWIINLDKKVGNGTLKWECFKDNTIKIENYDINDNLYLNESHRDTDIYSSFVNKMQIGDFVLVFLDEKSVDAIGVVTGDCQKGPDNFYSRPVNWYFNGDNHIIVHIYGNESKNNLDNSPLYELTNIDKKTIINIIEKNADINNSIDFNKDIPKPHVFIIDEINRGNISKIFGELITLIEPSKRLGADEEISVTLPYSKESFGVPENVYILGTMNTADRSLTRIDTALRRRFTFKEILPNTNVLQGIKVDGIDIAKLLDIMNKRIEFLLDRDHTIGHAYFVGLKDNGTMDKLAEIFRDRIIPLLQEYFYEDYKKIQMVLGDSDDDAESNFVIKESREDTLFKNRDISGDLPDARYKINEKAFDRIESYKKIYE